MIVRRIAITSFIGLSLSLLAAEPGIPKLPPQLGDSSFVITAAGELYAWGPNYYGELGIGTTMRTAAPVLVQRPAGVRGWKAVSSGSVSSAITEDGELYRWGWTVPPALRPLLVSKPSTVNRWVDVARADFADLLALADDGNLYQWVNRSTVPRLVPKPQGVNSWLKATSSRSYYVALADNGELFEWDFVSADEMISPSKIARPEGITRWRDVSCGIHLRVALADNGEIYQEYFRWPSGTHRLVPRPPGVAYWKRISAGYNDVAAIGSDDRMYVWGENMAPVSVSFPQGVRKWVSVSAGFGSFYMIGDDCRLYVRTTGLPVIVPNLEDLCRPGLPQPEAGSLLLAPFHPLFQREREFRFHVLGNVAEPFVLLRSRDLNIWTPVSTNVPMEAWRALSDTNVGSADSYFYRVAVP